MAGLGDFVALILTIAVFGGIIYGVLLANGAFSQGVQSTRERLKERGLDISDKGMSVKTSKRMNREDYVDATQRGIIKAMNASSFRKNSQDATSPAVATSPSFSPSLQPPPLRHSASSSSIGSTGSGSEKKKRSFFGKKKKDQD